MSHATEAPRAKASLRSLPTPHLAVVPPLFAMWMQFDRAALPIPLIEKTPVAAVVAPIGGVLVTATISLSGTTRQIRDRWLTPNIGKLISGLRLHLSICPICLRWPRCSRPHDWSMDEIVICTFPDRCDRWTDPNVFGSSSSRLYC